MKTGKVVMGTYNYSSNFPSGSSFVNVTQGDDYMHGILRTSPAKNFSLVFNDGHLEMGETSNWISGIVCLIENDNLLWEKEFERPINAAVSDNGSVVLLYTIHRDYSNMSSRPKEFADLGGTLAVLDKSGETLMTTEFGSNIEACAISLNSNLVSVATVHPDNSVYCFDIQEKKLLWKYKNHLKIAVLGLEFNGNEMDVLAGHSIATRQKEYALKLDGTLTPEFQKQLESLQKIKKQGPKEKTDSLLAMVNSGNKREVTEGLIMLESFVKTKGSVANYPTIVDALGRRLQAEDNTFDLIWKVARQMLKQNPETLHPIIPHIISRVRNAAESDATGILSILGEVGKANPEWVKNEEEFIKQKLRSKFWNERRFAAKAIGSIGSANPSWAENSIQLLIEYAAEPERVKKEFEDLATKDHDVSVDLMSAGMLGTDPATWIRDACIDSLGLIGKRSPASVSAAVPMLERLSTDAPSPYTMRKAIRALDAIRGKK